MHQGETWQVFGVNGDPIPSVGTYEDDVSKNSGVGIAQLWLWRSGESGIELLLQKRSMTKKRYPGFYGSSAGGHVNLGESFTDALRREALEEIGVELDINNAQFVAELHTPLEPQSIRRVFLYQVSEALTPSFSDGEVESAEWIGREELKRMMQNPDESKLVNQGKVYFDCLTAAIEKL